ncbi:hypothetical protein J7T55_008225 [Diaporthe amygdali]|uniref:uncharacterized protein n=1 Tax=Phomopsis amygdali TaxID=1214568 RepID=UPI0022FF1F4C|nr:uncharacterized protein J7T55_008225 [Diaporthe amygdali]KAJ0121065.1 hypothetical protein J7T55_008225 [Diaporthe amygdali]
MWSVQMWIDSVREYHGFMKALAADDLPGPMKPGVPRIPWDTLEYVPILTTLDFQTRLRRLNTEKLDELNRVEITAARGEDILRGDRQLDAYHRNESFIDRTLSFIFELITLDAGLSRDRVLDIGRMFHSILMMPWYNQFGHLRQLSDDTARETDDMNSRFRLTLLVMDDYINAGPFRPDIQRDAWVRDFWGSTCYQELLLDGNIRNPTINNVERSAFNRWQTFYKDWLRILLGVELTGVRLTQQQLDAESLQSCAVCADDYDVNNDYDCPVYINCGNGHTLYDGLAVDASRQCTAGNLYVGEDLGQSAAAAIDLAHELGLLGMLSLL